jgi:hypothetical protein
LYPKATEIPEACKSRQARQAGDTAKTVPPKSRKTVARNKTVLLAGRELAALILPTWCRRRALTIHHGMSYNEPVLASVSRGSDHATARSLSPAFEPDTSLAWIS